MNTGDDCVSSCLLTSFTFVVREIDDAVRFCQGFGDWVGVELCFRAFQAGQHPESRLIV